MNAVFAGAHVLTMKDTGRLSFNAQQDRLMCGTKWITPYFVNGTLPPEGTVCEGMQKPFAGSD
jgi:hypothetical protein